MKTVEQKEKTFTKGVENAPQEMLNDTQAFNPNHACDIEINPWKLGLF